MALCRCQALLCRHCSFRQGASVKTRRRSGDEKIAAVGRRETRATRLSGHGGGVIVCIWLAAASRCDPSHMLIRVRAGDGDSTTAYWRRASPYIGHLERWKLLLCLWMLYGTGIPCRWRLTLSKRPQPAAMHTLSTSCTDIDTMTKVITFDFGVHASSASLICTLCVGKLLAHIK